MKKVERGEVIALALVHSATYAIGSGRGTERRETFMLAKVTSITRDGRPKVIRMPKAMAPKNLDENLKWWHIDEPFQTQAKRLFDRLDAQPGLPKEFEDVAELRAAIKDEEDNDGQGQADTDGSQTKT